MAAANPPMPSIIAGAIPTALKAPATSSMTKADPPIQAQRRLARAMPSDFLSEKATSALIRRTLCAQHMADRGRKTPAPVQDLLPPLTSRNDVDLELYALISIIIREFVQNWYAKITPDETFVAEIVQIIAHCTRALEQRLRNVDLESLLFDELPELLDAHVRAYRASKSSVLRPPAKVDSRQIYHAMCPLPALSPVPNPDDPKSIRAQAQSESAYRQLLVQGVLAVLLPTEDLENDCLTSLVGQIFSELIIGNLVAVKVSEPWLIWEGLAMLARLIRRKSSPETSESDRADTTPQGTDAGEVQLSKNNRFRSIHQTFWSVVQWGFLAVTSIRLIIGTILLSRSLPPRSASTFVRPLDSTSQDRDEKYQHPSAVLETPLSTLKVPVLDFHIWSCASNLLEMEARMPWLCGALSMMQWAALKGPGQVAAYDGILDRLLSHHIQAYILDPAHLPPLLRAIRAAIFPNNAPGSPSLVPPSSDEQLAALRRRCASALLALVPKRVGRLYYGTSTWPWSGTKVSSAQSSASQRFGPLNSKISSNNIAHNATSSKTTGQEAPRVRLTDEGNPGLSGLLSNATLTLGSKRQLEETSDGSSHQASMCHEEEDDDDEDRILSEIETGILDIFSDPYCNKHLLYGIIELLLVRLIPELAEKGIGELWEERLS
ncbi:PXA domain-containing protein [Biscogniauxia sp. FL1348]|nr:PXA domain-containing protein [Biscogniauxia sp. FL1348]